MDLATEAALKKLMDEAFGDEDEAKTALAEWLGYRTVADDRFQKTDKGKVVGGDPALSIDEFCLREGICRATYHREVARGKGPRFYKIGAVTRIPMSEARAYREARMREAEAAMARRADEVA